jgi:hypothetical protein
MNLVMNWASIELKAQFVELRAGGNHPGGFGFSPERKMEKFPDGAYSYRGGRSPIPGFASRGRKRGTCTRGTGVVSRAVGQRSPTLGPASVPVAPGEGGGGLSQGGDGPLTGQLRSEGGGGRRP